MRAQVHAAISSLHPTSLVCIGTFVCVNNVARSLLELGSVCHGVEWYALSLAFALAGSKTPSSALPLVSTSQTAPISKQVQTTLTGKSLQHCATWMALTLCVCVHVCVCDVIKMAAWRP